MDIANFIAHVKIEEIYKDIAEETETRFYTLNFELDRPFPKGRNKRSNWINER